MRNAPTIWLSLTTPLHLYAATTAYKKDISNRTTKVSINKYATSDMYSPYSILFWRSQFFPLDVAQKIRNATQGIPTIAKIINVPIILPPVLFLTLLLLFNLRVNYYIVLLKISIPCHHSDNFHVF